MIPRIIKAEPLYQKWGFKYMIKGKHGIDMTTNLEYAVRYWLWHLGIPAKICFNKWKRN